MYQHCPLKHKEDPMPRVQQLYLKNCDPNDKAIINLRAKWNTLFSEGED